MHQERKHHSGNGFLWGLVLGGALATLLSTKKGRAILKDLAEMGLEALENFLEEEAVGEYQEEIMEEPALIPPPITEVHTSDSSTPNPVPPKKRKLFKGLRKK